MNISAITSLNTSSVQRQGRSADALPEVAVRASRFDMNDVLELTGAEKVTREAEKQAAKPKKELTEEDKEFRKVMHQLVGEVLFGTMMRQFREAQEPDPYFHGGRGEELFQSQLDQIYVERMTNASSHSISDAMFNQMQRIMGKAEI